MVVRLNSMRVNNNLIIFDHPRIPCNYRAPVVCDLKIVLPYVVGVYVFWRLLNGVLLSSGTDKKLILRNSMMKMPKIKKCFLRCRVPLKRWKYDNLKHLRTIETHNGQTLGKIGIFVFLYSRHSWHLRVFKYFTWWDIEN